MSVVEDIKESVITGNVGKVREYTENAVSDGLDVAEILNDGLIGGMTVVGVRFRDNEVYVPEVLVAALAMRTGMAVIKPLLADSTVRERGVVVLGTVKGDLHDIGKNLVAMMLEGAGYRVIDLGIDAMPEKFVEGLAEYRPQIIGLSTLLTTTMNKMKETVAELRTADASVKIMVGGAPVTQAFADDIGADGYAADAGSAVDLAKELLVS